LASAKEVAMYLERAKKIWRGVGTHKPAANSMRLGLQILERYAGRMISPGYVSDYSHYRACRIDAFDDMTDDDIRTLFELGWHFDHHMEWWVLPDWGS